MQVDREQFTNILKRVQPGLAKKEIVEHSTSFLFYSGMVATYNDQIAISHPVQDLDFSGAVDAYKLYNLLDRLKKNQVEIKVEDNQLKIHSGRSRAGILFQKTIATSLLHSLKDVFKIENLTWKQLPAKFIEGITLCGACASQNMTMPELTTLHIKGNFIEACDNFRIAKYSLSTPFPAELLIPVISLVGLKEFDPSSYAIKENWIYFKNAQKAIYAARLLKGTYPQLSNTLLEKSSIKFKIPSKLKDILQRATLFSEEVNIHINDNNMLVHSRGEAGWFKEKLPIKYESKAHSFLISSKVLLELPVKNLVAELTARTIRFKEEDFIYCCSIQAQKEKE